MSNFNKKNKSNIIIILLLFIITCDNSDKKPLFDIKKYNLTKQRAIKFSQMAFDGIEKEFPYKAGHVINNADDLQLPKIHHPSFYGCFDWHSSVHGHWLLVYILKEYQELPNRENIISILDKHFSAQNIKKEAEYFNQPNRKSFERTYGWAWLLKLCEELYTWDNPQAKIWYKNLSPLANIISQRYIDFLPKQTYPIRRGVHPNTAFGIAFALDYAKTTKNSELEKMLIKSATNYFSKDKNYPVSWEIEGDAFISPSLMEASLMSRLMEKSEFQSWFENFLPNLFNNSDHVLMEPAIVTDRSDPKLVHLDGLNLSRVWCMAQIAKSLEPDQQTVINQTIIKHFDYSLPALDSKHYEGSHWLASFAVYALKNVKELADSNLTY